MPKTLNHAMADEGLLMPWILEIHLFITLLLGGRRSSGHCSEVGYVMCCTPQKPVMGPFFVSHSSFA